MGTTARAGRNAEDYLGEAPSPLILFTSRGAASRGPSTDRNSAETARPPPRAPRSSSNSSADSPDSSSSGLHTKRRLDPTPPTPQAAASLSIGSSNDDEIQARAGSRRRLSSLAAEAMELAYPAVAREDESPIIEIFSQEQEGAEERIDIEMDEDLPYGARVRPPEGPPLAAEEATPPDFASLFNQALQPPTE